MKNYNILIVFILISILSGCGGKNYLGEKIVCKFRFIGSPIPLATDQCFRL